jgi:L-threonine kinase
MNGSLVMPVERFASATVSLPGTCGEWVQGTLDGEPCLVSCPVDWYGSVTVRLDDNSDTWVLPPGAPKAATALRKGLAALRRPNAGGTLLLSNPLPQARGYASSTVDVAGTILALAGALGQSVEPALVARLAVQVEPSDSIMFPGLALFAHRSAAFHRNLGPAARLSIVIVDPGGAVDTLAFNQVDHGRILKRLAPQHRDAFAGLEAGLAAGDGRTVAQAATLSALAFQAILPNPLIEPALDLGRRAGALGLVRAHSGTLVGLVCEPERAGDVARLAGERFAGCTIRRHRCL